MHAPPAFVQTDLDRILALIKANNFGVLVSRMGDTMTATHVPFTVRRDDDTLVLEGHLAAANPQCAGLDAAGPDAATSLAIFSGPHAYISPSWYRTQPAVPTWDYTAVHVHGALQSIEPGPEADTMMRLLGAHDARGFDMDALPTDFRERIMRGVRPFRLRSQRIEAQWKLSQNRSVVDRAAVIAALREAGNDPVADLIADTLPPAA